MIALIDNYDSFTFNVYDYLARKSDREIMAIENSEMRIFGLQFHPESYATPEGMTFINNFLEVCYGDA
jgi:anthranilate synthase component 2